MLLAKKSHQKAWQRKGEEERRLLAQLSPRKLGENLPQSSLQLLIKCFPKEAVATDVFFVFSQEDAPSLEYTIPGKIREGNRSL